LKDGDPDSPFAESTKTAGAGLVCGLRNERRPLKKNRADRLDLVCAGRNFAATQVFFQNVNAIA
jgi:hypothetical protein